MTEPLVVEVDVRTTIEHAFSMWTDHCVMWWPRSHTITGNPANIVFEPRAGGRAFERGPDGAEHACGEVLDWDPPGRMTYRCHLFFEPSQATYLLPVVAVILGALILAEPITVQLAVGVAIVLVGVALTRRKPAEQHALRDFGSKA